MRRVIFSVLALGLGIFLITGCGKKTEADLMAEGKQYEQSQQLEKALVTYEKLMVNYPDTPQAPEVYFKIAQVAGSLKQFEKCIDAYQQIVEQFPDHSIAQKSQFMIGYVYANEQKNFEKAKEAYQYFLNNYSEADSGMTASAEFELKYLGKDISDIDFLQNLIQENE